MEHIPQVTRDDVLRIIRRDFPSDDPSLVLAELDQYGRESWQGERDRVQLATIKLSRGDLDQVRQHVATAQQDYRDILGAAEFPCSFSAVFSGAGQAQTAQSPGLQAADWKQYHTWLTSDECCGGAPDALAVAGEAAFLHGPPKRKRGMPGWAAPIVGPLVGIGLAMLGFFDRDNPSSMLLAIGVGAVLGFVAGMAMWVLDRKLP